MEDNADIAIYGILNIVKEMETFIIEWDAIEATMYSTIINK
jgi:hypothetical protein